MCCRRVTDCHVASLLAMTCRNMRLSAVATAWCQANLSRFRIRPRRYFLLCPAAGVTDCHVASLLAMTCCNMHLPAWQGRFPSGKFVALFRIPQASPPCPCEHLASFCMSLRTSAHTGAAIRVPAEMPGKLAAARANSLRLTYLPKVLFFTLCYCKENGLPRRSAPRNDMLKFVACPHNARALPGYCRKASLQP